ncbi:MAG TPA: RHS repeat-associated core domain-containing protein, partial [Atribacterota bacterium]|nr:RHS repeat-associated core domain-containing protein [Atribacterota bacterium]
VRLAQNEYHYDYFLSDHLGNIRVVFTQGPDGEVELLQSSNYYPFGMLFGTGPEYESEQNKYLYNGKELQEYAGLEMYDYGWRQYDAALGRWNVQDKLAESFPGYSPYNYVKNSPINYIDPNGMYPDS